MTSPPASATSAHDRELGCLHVITWRAEGGGRRICARERGCRRPRGDGRRKSRDGNGRGQLLGDGLPRDLSLLRGTRVVALLLPERLELELQAL